ncbi:response regulator transcription factor [Flavobacterium beibuense]|uniref:ATP-dependent transcriptional regulator, MalT-like, LuxR family n=1 Tax=Flavobacterium beibuense TaxID=657326 RepID=A0A444W3Y3_9FLAO|nr:LuxR C-terminal-related transcriptional regulator [Flavobacterium beibuense]RYJ40483.1 ATP-dependent transcriptional regulator, MalT-like, LuxR family [Flavobacterium beibuense]
MFKAFKKHKDLILYSSSLALLLLLLRWLEFRFLVLSTSLDIYIGIIAAVFMGLGIWLALKLFKPKPKTIVVEKEVYVTPTPEFVLNQKELDNLNLTIRELEVLELMAKGMSNKEIADQLFVSLNTIKTHSGKLFEKMEVKRRTQAVEKAKRLSIIP